MLFRKMLRTIGRYKAQFISMIIMIALGLGIFLGFNMEWYSLRRDTDEILDATNFADFRIVSEAGFSAEDRENVSKIGGVNRAGRFLSVNVAVKGDPDSLAFTVTEDPDVSGVYLISGSAYDADDADGLWLSDKYAAANNISVGDSLTLELRSLEFSGTVRGLVKSGEYLICMADANQVMPDYDAFGFVYASPAFMKQALGFEYYTQINVLSGLGKAEFTALADRALGRTELVLSKAENVSWAESEGEVEEGKTMGAIMPVVFLAIAILTMITTMHRITASEKTQIGTLKALGFRDRTILIHYTSFSALIGISGLGLGIALGYLVCWFILNPGGAMATYIDVIAWKRYVPPFCWFVLAGVLLLIVALGLISVRRMLKGTAADTLRPYTPSPVRHTLLEKGRFWEKLGFGVRWNLRDTFRHKARSIMSLLGVIGCALLLSAAFGMQDTMNAFVKQFYNDSLNYENRINISLTDSPSNEDVIALAEQYGGDYSAAVNVQLGDEPVSLEIWHLEHDSVRFPAEGEGTLALADTGAYICKRISDDFGLKPGDTVSVSPYGSDETYTLPVAGIVRSMTESINISDVCAEKYGIPFTYTRIYTDAADISPSPLVANVQSRAALIESFDSFRELLDTAVILLIIVASILGLVVLYNLGVMSYTERYRELATLKVVGFRDRQIGRILISQNLWLTLLGILIGLPLGIATLKYLMDALASEYELRIAISWPTIVASTLLVLAVSLLVSALIALKNRKIDMVEALKGE